jgi:hypothetical protein
MTTAIAKPPKHPLVNGHPIHFRTVQMYAWLAPAIVIGTGFGAGIYWLFFEQKYGPVSLKGWWDGSAWISLHDAGLKFIDKVNWATYRHGWRNEIEPVAATLLAGSFLAKPVRFLAPGWVMAAAPAVLLIVATIGAFFVTWFINYGPLMHKPDPGQLYQILGGVILGRVLHYAWRPVGSSYQAHLIGHSVGTGRTPLWVTLPLMPPVWRERWTKMSESSAALKVIRESRENHKILRWVIPTGAFLFLVIAIIGNLAKYVIAKGGHIPGMVS